VTWRTHVLGGVASLWLLKALPEGIGSGAALNNAGALAMAAALGALLPDLDAPRSKVQSLSLWGGGIQPFVLPSLLLHRAFGHRGLLHSAAGLVLFTLLFALPLSLWLGWQPAVALSLGYASHLALDACTKSGIPAWYPDRRRRHLLPPALRLVTGSAAEDVVFALLLLPVLLLLLTNLQASTSRLVSSGAGGDGAGP